MLFVMAGGGTGGHVMPAIAVAQELQRQGHACLFIGTREGLESRLVPQAGFPLEWIPAAGFQRAGLRGRAAALSASRPSIQRRVASDTSTTSRSASANTPRQTRVTAR